MAREKVDNKLNVVIGTKAQVEADNTIPDNSIVIVTDEEYIVSPWTYLGSRTSNGNMTIQNLNSYSEIRIDVIPDLHAEVVDSDEYYLGDSKIIPPTLLTEKNTLTGLPSKSRTSGVSLNIKDSLGTKQVTIYGSYTTNNAYVVTGLPSAYQFELFVYGR